MTPKHFKELAFKNQTDTKGLGSIIVAAGSHKSLIIIAALKSHAVNHLFIDERLAEGIIKIINKK